MTVIIATGTWIAVLTLLALRQWRREPWTLYAAFAIAIGVTLNLDPVYIAVDGALGGHNYGDLIANTSIVLGVLCFARAIDLSSDDRRSLTRVAFGLPALAITVVCSTIAFFLIETDGTSTRFMVDYGDQLAAGVYSGVQHAYYGIVAAGMVAICIRQLPGLRGYERGAVITLMIGATLMVITCVDVLVMDYANVVGIDWLLSAGQSIYNPLNTAAFVVLELALVAGPVVRAVMRNRRDRAIRALSSALHPEWARAVAAHGSFSGTELQEEPEARLHRQVVDLRDGQSRSSDDFRSPALVRDLERAEQLLLTDPRSHTQASRA